MEKLINLGGEAITRQELAKVLGITNERSVDVRIKRLRDKIEDNPSNPKYLQTLRNTGYILYVV